MIASTPFYWEVIRKTTIVVGKIFSDIKIARREKSGAKDIIQTVNVPVAVGNKDKWFQRTDQDPSLENQVYNTLPRISYELIGITYDPARKLNRLNKITCRTEDGANTVFAGTPYTLDYAVYLVAKTQEDCMQMVEQILPYFAPELTVSMMIIPNQNIIHDVPFILESTTIEDDFEGDFATRRTVIYTLNIRAKVTLYGPQSTPGLIKDVIVNFPEQSPTYSYEASQETPVSPVVEVWTE